jgi:hypothetical protein
MNTLIIPVSPTENFIKMAGFISLTDEEQQLAIDEQLMLDREAYYEAPQY